MYEKVDEREAIAQYQVSPVDTKWVDKDEASEAEPWQLRSRIVARAFKSEDRTLEALISIAANHREHFLSRAHRRVTCIRSCKKLRDLCQYDYPVGGQNGRRCLKNGSADKEYVLHTRRRKQLGA